MHNMAAKVQLFFHSAKFYMKYKCSKSQQGALIAYFETIFVDFESKRCCIFAPTHSNCYCDLHLGNFSLMYMHLPNLHLLNFELMYDYTYKIDILIY